MVQPTPTLAVPRYSCRQGCNNDRVQKFAPDGTFLTAFGEPGDGLGQFRHAIAVDVADDGTVFVADFLNNRIQKWRPRR